MIRGLDIANYGSYTDFIWPKDNDKFVFKKVNIIFTNIIYYIIKHVTKGSLNITIIFLQIYFNQFIKFLFVKIQNVFK